MAETDLRMKDAIARILDDHTDTVQGWSDEQIVAEACRRAGQDTAPDAATLARWSTLVAELRGATDNDGMARADRTS